MGRKKWHMRLPTQPSYLEEVARINVHRPASHQVLCEVQQQKGVHAYELCMARKCDGRPTCPPWRC